MKSGVKIAIHFLIVAAILVPGVWNVPDLRHGWNDFLHFYAGAKLAFSHDLYNVEAVAAAQRATGASPSPALRVTRPPHYYMLLSPLALAPYPIAYLLWQLLNFAAVIGAIWLWPYSRIALCHVLVFWLPLWWGFFSGSDSGLVLLLIACVIRGIASRRDDQTALGLAYCTIKYHFFWMAPFALGWRISRMAAAAVVLVLFIGPLLVNPSWPGDYLTTVVAGRDIISKVPMSLFRFLSWYAVALGAISGFMILRTVKAPELRLLSVFTIGVLVSPHCYIQDYTGVSLLLAIALERFVCASA